MHQSLMHDKTAPFGYITIDTNTLKAYFFASFILEVAIDKTVESLNQYTNSLHSKQKYL